MYNDIFPITCLLKTTMLFFFPQAAIEKLVCFLLLDVDSSIQIYDSAYDSAYLNTASHYSFSFVSLTQGPPS